MVLKWQVPGSSPYRANYFSLFRIVTLLPSALLSINVFDTRNILKHTRVPLRSFSGLWDKKNSDGETWYPHPPFIHKFFPHLKFSETQKGSPTKFLGTMRLTIFYGKSWYPPIMKKFFRNPKISETQKGSAAMFLILWDKKFPTEKLDTPPPFIHVFSIPESFWNTKGFRRDVFRYCETKNFRRKNVISPLLSMFFFLTRKFLKDKRVPPRCYSVLWYKKLSTEKRDTPSYPYFSSIPEIFWNTKGFRRDVFRYYETRNFRWKIMIPSSYEKIFSKPENFGNTEGFRRDVFWYCETKHFA